MEVVSEPIKYNENFYKKDARWTCINKADLSYSFIILSHLLVLILFPFGYGYSLYHFEGSLTLGIKLTFVIVPLLFVILYPLHQFLHGLYFSFLKGKTILSFHKYSMKYYYDSNCGKKDFLIGITFPLIILTGISFLIFLLDKSNLVLYLLLSVNGVLSLKDIWRFLFVWRKTPKNSIVRMNGDELYYYVEEKYLKAYSKKLKKVSTKKKIIKVLNSYIIEGKIRKGK